MPTLRAIKELRYASQQRAPGDVFEASERDARLLVAIRKAEAHDPDKPRRGRPPKPKPEPEQADTKVAAKDLRAAAPDPDQQDQAEDGKRTYRRRDMQAED